MIGNAYTFLALYKRTKSKNYLMKACAFVSRYFEIMNNKDDSPFNTPDSPYSLYEGVSMFSSNLI